MIVKDIMITKLVTVEPGDTLSHAANILRQYQFHHLPVVRSISRPGSQQADHAIHTPLLLLEGMLTSQDIDMVVALAKQSASGDILQRPWQEQRVVELMHRAAIRVTPTTSVAAAAQLLVERNLNSLPVVEYEADETGAQTVLVGLITRSDLLLALARMMGALEPGMQLDIPLPSGAVSHLARTLALAAELHIQVRSIVAAPAAGGVPQTATLRLGTINPTPLLVRLREAGIDYSFADSLIGENDHA
ncbi:MAG TPA: CBS domain-containing protein [Ktedonobacteraceae bacterium]|nr:CBS domain-containing protein [Ktedonobacteraceae bacterium]